MPNNSTKDKPDPHTCLQCGSEILRGRAYNKKRHWLQKHSYQPEKGYAKQIVPKDHELAQKLLEEKKDRKTSLWQSTEDSSSKDISTRGQRRLLSL